MECECVLFLFFEFFYFEESVMEKLISFSILEWEEIRKISCVLVF